MSSTDPTPETQDARPSVFLSYASEDRVAARIIRDALPALGLEPWYDESELGGGEAWDQKIRNQIRGCDYFMPIISATTELRHEGYFRREWRLAVERTLDMADDHAFLLPVVIDDTDQARARVPEKFLTVQWLRLPGGQPTPAFTALCRRITSSQPAKPASARKAAAGAKKAQTLASVSYPEFPREEPGQRVRFWFQALGWGLHAGWLLFKRLPRWLQIILTIWLVIVMLSTSKHNSSPDIPTATSKKMKAMSEKYDSGPNAEDVKKMAKQLAREFADDPDESVAEPSPLMAVPFTAPSGDKVAGKRVDSIFALVYGRLSMSHHGQVMLAKDAMPAQDLSTAVARARAGHSAYVLFGKVESGSSALTVEIVKVADGTVKWSKSYPLAGADAGVIATEVDAGVPALTDP